MARRRHSAGERCRSFRNNGSERDRLRGGSGRGGWRGSNSRGGEIDGRLDWCGHHDGVPDRRRLNDRSLTMLLRFYSTGCAVTPESDRSDRPDRTEDEQDGRERATAKPKTAAALLGDYPRFMTAVQADLRAGALLVRTILERGRRGGGRMRRHCLSPEHVTLLGRARQ